MTTITAKTTTMNKNSPKNGVVAPWEDAGIAGSPLLQDESKALSKALSNTPGAHTHAAEAAAAIAGLAGIPQEFPEVLEQGSITKAMAGATKGIVWKAAREMIHIYPGLNVRAETPEYVAHCEAIGRSMYAEGWYDDKPLGGFIGPDGKVYVKDGHSRLRGYDYALTLGCQIDHIPVVVSAGKDFSIQDITIGLVKSNEGRPLQPIEKAVVCRRLSKWGWDSAKIGDRLDMTPRYVDELIALLGAPTALVELVQTGAVSASTAMKAIKDDGAGAAAAAIVAAVEVKKAVAAKKAPKGAPVAPVKVTAKDLKGAKKAPAGVTPAAAPKAPAPAKEAPKMMDVLRAVFNDPNFNKLADKVQDMVLTLAT